MEKVVQFKSLVLKEEIQELLNRVREVEHQKTRHEDHMIIVSRELRKCSNRLSVMEVEVNHFEMIRETSALSLREHYLLQIQEERWKREIVQLADKVRTLLRFYE